MAGSPGTPGPLARSCGGKSVPDDARSARSITPQFVRLVAAWLLGIASQSAMADTWQGNLATLQDAQSACRD